MGKKNQALDAQKLQEVILSKTLSSIQGPSPESTTPKSQKTKVDKTTSKKEVKKVEVSSKAHQKKSTSNSSIREDKVKYVYPPECSDSLSRKKFRANFRTEKKQMENKLSQMEKTGKKASSEYKKLSKEYQEYLAKFLKG